MDRALWLKHLAKAERHVRQAERNVSDQSAVLANLRRDGHPTRTAEHLLKQYEELLVLHRLDRDRIKQELET